MMVPCIVKSWLYASPLAIVSSAGLSSSQRMPIANAPPMMKKKNAVAMYCTPMIL